MGSKIGAAIIVIVIVSIAGVMAYYLYSSSRSFSGHLKNTTKRMSVYDEMMYNANFIIKDAKYFTGINKTKKCNKSNKTGILVVRLLFNMSKLPESCEFFIDNRFRKKIPISLPCWPNCNNDDFIEAVSINKVHTWKKHSIKVCCDTLCAKKDISALCP